MEFVFLSLFILVPALLLTLVRPAARRWFFVLGLIVGFGSDFVVRSGPDSPALIVPLAGFGIAAGALLTMLVAFSRRAIRRVRASGS